jgi:L-cysteine:1D-myo-inositol 2-amino-2-deoxy-alpha-D-glucopyranoside ligase
MPLALFHTPSGRPEPVEVRPRMGVYVCGITPYDTAHLGHAFTYVQFDVLVRYLRHLGAEVVHVQNVTDVDDDILGVARERGVDHADLARREEASFRDQMRAIGVMDPTHSPWASEYVPDMVADTGRLLAAGVAYRRNGTVYFRVAADPRYGRLSGLSREEMIPLAAERGGRPDDPNKDDPLDFVLWQPSAPGEPVWDSPWGPGRPGWHIECSTMARRLIGDTVDVHGGGSDLIFPHHESELVQAENPPGGPPFVRRWMHTGVVHQDGQKMSKSLGNMTFVGDLLVRHEPMAIRRLLLSRHYREEWTFDEGQLDGPPEGPEMSGSGATVEGCRAAFFGALDRDLDTPAALRSIDVARTLPGSEELLREAEAILGLSGAPS